MLEKLPIIKAKVFGIKNNSWNGVRNYEKVYPARIVEIRLNEHLVSVSWCHSESRLTDP
jgi:hypothetical protein